MRPTDSAPSNRWTGWTPTRRRRVTALGPPQPTPAPAILARRRSGGPSTRHTESRRHARCFSCAMRPVSPRSCRQAACAGRRPSGCKRSRARRPSGSGNAERGHRERPLRSRHFWWPARSNGPVARPCHRPVEPLSTSLVQDDQPMPPSSPPRWPSASATGPEGRWWVTTHRATPTSSLGCTRETQDGNSLGTQLV